MWLNQEKIAQVFDTTRNNVTMHIKNILTSNDLDNSVCKDFLHTAKDGKKYKTKFYNLDMIIAVGYRVNSDKAINFRKWATKVLKEYMVKGFAMNDDKLKKLGGGNYWRELIERIRDIRSSEKEYIGLMSFSGEQPTLAEVKISS